MLAAEGADITRKMTLQQTYGSLKYEYWYATTFFVHTVGLFVTT